MSPTNPERSPDSGSSTPQFGLGDQVHLQARQRRGNVILWGIFALLLVLTAGVFFVLPRYVQPVDATAASVTVVTPTPGPAAAQTALSPFEEAQRMRQREAAQATLAELLQLQAALDAASVREWAAADFDAALDHARKGDEAYRTQDFLAADTSYGQGLELLRQLEASKPAVYARYMQEGAAAIAAGNATAADTAYGIALLVDPTSADAVTGMERAKVLDEVLSLLEAGRNLQAGGQLEEAREQYRKAQQLDAGNQEAPRAIAAVNEAIAARDFAAAMSRGYAALQRGEPAQARTAFNQAAAMRPGSDEVTAALQQAADQETFTAVTVHIDAANRAEAEERWADALAAWQKALEVDPNLVSALDGVRRSESRNNLDTYLEGLLAQPLSLSEDEVHQRARQVLVDAGRIPGPGPRLQGQLQRVERFLDLSRVPATVSLQSDGQTAVTVYRVGELGMFSAHTLTLLPGAYVAVGTRPGYRDVRQEFVVPLEGAPPVVTVSCSERI